MAISEERKKQLLELVGKLRTNPELQEQLLQPKPTVKGILGEVGAPVTTGTVSKATGEAIRRTSPEFLREEETIGQAKRGGFLPPSLTGIREAPPETLQVTPTGIDPETGAPIRKITSTPEEEARQKGLEVTATKQAETIANLATGQRISFTNLEKVAGSISDLDRVVAESVREGGAGNIVNEKLFQAARFIGGAAQDAFPATSAREGKKAEVLFNMIPMLTQQGEKPGSVRIMRSVLKLLGLTLPELKTGLKSARRMMSESIRSFFRFARAAELSGLEFDKEFEGQDLEDIGANELSKWIDKVKRASERVQLGSEEEEALDDLIDSALQKTGELISERQQERGGGLTEEEQAEFEELKKQFGE